MFVPNGDKGLSYRQYANSLEEGVSRQFGASFDFVGRQWEMTNPTHLTESDYNIPD